MPISGYSGTFESSASFGTGIGAEIIRLLRAYNKSLPIAFLAHALQRTVSEVEPSVVRLEELGVLKRQEDQVRLAE